MSATENSIKGADQRTEQFQESWLRFVKLCQPAGIEPTRYENRGARNIWCFLRDDIFPDVQNFGRALNVIKSSDPTGGCSEKDIYCISIAHHFKFCQGINYDYRTKGSSYFDPVKKWINYLAFLELRTCTKFHECPSVDIRTKKSAKQKSLSLSSSTLVTQDRGGLINQDEVVDADMSDMTVNSGSAKG
jgi:hypothetical protein